MKTLLASLTLVLAATNAYAAFDAPDPSNANAQADAQAVEKTRTTASEEVNSLRALQNQLDALADAQKFDEIAAIHAKELQRYREAKNFNDEREIREARSRLVAVDQHYLRVLLFDDVKPFFGGPRGRVLPEPVYAKIIETGNQIAREIEEDPYLFVGANECCWILLVRGYEDDAVSLRDKILEKIDLETAERAMRQVGGKDPATSVILHEAYFDESILDDVPENESKEFYQALRRKIQIAVQDYRNVHTPQRRLDEVNGKAQVAFMRLSERLGEPIIKEFAFKRRGKLVPDFYEVQFATLTPQSAAFLRKAVEDESAKPFDELRAQFVDYAQTALQAYELDEAIRSENRQAVADACERFVERADVSASACERAYRDVKKRARSNPEIAALLLERVLDKAEKSDGKLRLALDKFNEAKAFLERRTK